LPISELTGLALAGNFAPSDPALAEALQPVLEIMHEKYVSAVLIVKSTGADLYFGEDGSHYFNRKMLEEYISKPEFGLTNEFFAALMKQE